MRHRFCSRIRALQPAPVHHRSTAAGAVRQVPAQVRWRAIVICRDAAQDRCWDRVRPAEIGRTVRDSLERAEDDASVIIPTPSLTHDGFRLNARRL